MHLPANTFSARHETLGADTSASRGTVVTASATANTKGSYASLGTTAFAYEGITVYVCRSSVSADVILDIGVDGGGGNVSVLVEDLHFAGIKLGAEQNLQLHLPVHVPAGAALKVRCSSTTGSSTVDVVVIGHSANPGGFPGVRKIAALFTQASSRGVTIDPGGTANTKGSWTQLTSSSTDRAVGLLAVVGFNVDLARAATASMLLDIGIGAGGSEQVVLPNLSVAWGATWGGPEDVYFGPIACDVPSGTRFAARAACSITTAGDRTIDLALYALVP